MSAERSTAPITATVVMVNGHLGPAASSPFSTFNTRVLEMPNDDERGAGKDDKYSSRAVQIVIRQLGTVWFDYQRDLCDDEAQPEERDAGAEPR